MIGRLRGQLTHKSADHVIIDVGGVGYEVHTPLTVVESLPPIGGEVSLSIHTHVREDQLALFGFRSDAERSLYRLLIGISGVGPKLALACLSGLQADQLAEAILANDLRRLTAIPGIGKRTAERIVLELREKVAKTRFPGRGPERPGPASHLDDLESALRNLGYKARDVDKLVQELAGRADLSLEDLLREALQRLTR